jgi:hypothetical protein
MHITEVQDVLKCLNGADYEKYNLLRRRSVQSGRRLLTFWRKLMPPSSSRMNE